MQALSRQVLRIPVMLSNKEDYCVIGARPDMCELFNSDTRWTENRGVPWKQGIPFVATTRWNKLVSLVWSIVFVKGHFLISDF